jgi:hypothetical protein
VHVNRARRANSASPCEFARPQCPMEEPPAQAGIWARTWVLAGPVIWGRRRPQAAPSIARGRCHADLPGRPLTVVSRISLCLQAVRPS